MTAPTTAIASLTNAFPPRYLPVADPGEEPKARMGFFTDTTLCIGCKACEVACKQWNQLPSDGNHFTGNSYDNTGHLSESTWRHVAFVEKIGDRSASGDVSRWLMMSDVCKHCEDAPCLQACPTGSLLYNEFGDVYLQDDICNGCGYCVAACPFGVLGRSDIDGHAHKCTMCYDRQSGGMEPACAKVCPTNSIQFGPVDELQETARQRVEQLHGRGNAAAYLYGADGFKDYSPLNAFFLLEDHPHQYNLPAQPRHPFEGQKWRYAGGIAVGVVLSAVSAMLMSRRERSGS
jgi:formate dehydrogenase iron-sulfur subunit